MKRILVVGYGNPHRADDGIGYRAALEYLARNSDRGNVQVIAAETLKPDIVAEMSQANLVVFIDGSNCHGEPGSIWRQEIFSDETVDGVLAHPLTPPIALKACHVIYHRAPEAILLCVKGENYGFGSRVSPVVEATLPALMQRLDEIVLSAVNREAYACTV